MEDYDMFQLGQQILTAGNTFFEVLLKDTGCYGDVFNISYDQSNIDKLPVPPQDNEIYTLSTTFRRHNFAIVLNNRDRTVTVLDTDVNEDDIVRMNIVRHYQMYGYRHKPHTCPVDKLPQQNDMFCTLWTMYMIYNACQGIDPLDLIYSANIDRLKEFILYARDLFIESGLYDLHTRAQNIQMNYFLNRLPFNVDNYRDVIDKKSLLDSIDRDFRIKDRCIRTHTSHMYLLSMLNFVDSKYKFPDDVLYELAGACSISDIVNVIEKRYSTYYAREIIFVTFIIQTSRIFKMSLFAIDNLIRSTYSPEERDIFERYVIKYIPNILEVADSLNVYPTSYDNALEFIIAITAALGSGSDVPEMLYK